MIPILYPANETQFTNNGLGRLPDCLSCSVTEERNGVYELELVYPTTGHNYDQISIGKIVYTTHDATKTPQPFVIYKRSTPIDGHVTFSAHHISYRLSDMVVKPFSITGTAGQAMAAIGSHSVTSCPFTFSSDRSTRLTYTVSKPDTIRRLLGGVDGSILDVYGGGDYTFDKFSVIMGNRGADRGVTIRYGKQMTELTADQNEEGTYNGVVPFWANQDTMVTLPEWYVSNGTPTALAVLDLSSEWQEAPTVAQLRQKAQERLTSSAPWSPDENVTVSFVIQPEDYADVENLQRVVLCDTVSVIYPAAGVSTKIRVIKVVYDPLTERYTSIELGTPQTSLAQTIKEQAVSDTLKQTPTAGWMTEAIQNATDLITGGLGGHVVIGRNADGEPEEILIMDTDSTQTAVNVIRMNQNGIGFSTSGYAGPFTSAWTIGGAFNTDFIDVLNLSTLSANAGTITAGVLQSADYQGPASGSEYATLGMIIDLNNKIIRTPKTAILDDGSIYSSSVDLEGKITATSGEIGGFKIEATRIYSPVTVNGVTYRANMQSMGTSTDPSRLAFYVALDENGSTTYPFRVNYNGTLYTTMLQAVGGSIGGWKIGNGSNEYDGSLYYLPSGSSFGSNGTILLNPKGATTQIVIGDRRGTDWAVTIGSNFGITKTGHVEISDATIGRFSISSNGFSSVANGIATVINAQSSLTTAYALSIGATYASGTINPGTGKFRVNNSGTTYVENGLKVSVVSEEFIEFYSGSLNTSPTLSPLGKISTWHGGAGMMLYSENELWIRSDSNQVLISANNSNATGIAALYDANSIILAATRTVSSGALIVGGSARTTDNGTYYITTNLTKGTTPSSDRGYAGLAWLEQNYTTTDNAGRFASVRQYLTSGGTNMLQMLAYAPVAGSTTVYRLDIRATSSTGFVYTNCAIGVNKTGATDGNAGVWANTAGNLYLTGAASAGSYIYFYYNKATSSTANFHESSSGTITLTGNFNTTGNIVGSAEIHAGGKGTGSDGKAGSILSTAGHLSMQATSGSHIYFYYGSSTTVTSQLYESASGTLTASAHLNTTGNLTVATTSSTVERSVTVSTGNVSGSVRANNGGSGGAFGLYVTKTGGTARTGTWLSAMDSGGTYHANWTSDRREKNIIGLMGEQEAETLLRNVNIVNFSYKKDQSQTVQNGMIAQQLRDVLKENGFGYRTYLNIITARDDDFVYDLNAPEADVRYGIDYARLTPILWKGWQIHDGTIRNHEDRITTLERENEVLRAEIKALKGAA